MGRQCSFCKQKPRTKKRPWSPEEDSKLIYHITKNGHGCWDSVPKLAGLQRCGKSCRHRWINHLSLDLKGGAFSPGEKNLTITQQRHGCWNSALKLPMLALALLVLVSLSLALLNYVSTPTVSPPPDYHHHQVFINFRGDDVRYGFISHLGEDLKGHGINFFIDKHEERSKDITILFERVEESRVALAIFSVRYAESEWCLDELVKIMERVNMGKLRVIPIFYKVEPRDVRKQTGEFGDKFWELAKTSQGHQIKEWKDALELVPRKMGLTFGNKSYESDCIKEIVAEVERVLTAITYEDIENHSVYPLENKRID